MTEESKKARRDQAREHAREMREKERRRKARNGWFIKGGVGIALIAAAVVTILIVNNVQQAAVEAATPKPGPANMLSDGILLTGDGTGNIVAVPTAAIPADGTPVATDPTAYPDTVNIVTYVDYFCPVCQAFEQANAEQLNSWVSSGIATLEVHPIAILDNSSQGTRYSSRAANAMACVAEFQPNVYFPATTAMYANQPAEGTPGLTNDEITAVLTQGGVTAPEVAACIADERFKQWVTAATLRTSTGPLPNAEIPSVTGTPTVLVNGYLYQGTINDPNEFAQFVGAVANGTYAPTE